VHVKLFPAPSFRREPEYAVSRQIVSTRPRPCAGTTKLRLSALLLVHGEHPLGDRKPPKILTLAITTAARPSHFDTGDPAAALAISAPTMMTEEMALVTLISGVCSAGVTDQTTK
jgi:hypothetical protein